MAAKIVTISPSLIRISSAPKRLLFFPDGSRYLDYSLPHFQMSQENGFQQNLLLSNTFVVVLEGKFAVMNYWGDTTQTIHVRDQVWFISGTEYRAPYLYSQMVKKSRAR